VVAQPAVVEVPRAASTGAVRRPRVRRALHLALDRPALVTLKGWGSPRPAGEPGTVGFAPVIRTPDRDVGEARRLLAEAGHPHWLSVTLDFREDRRTDEIRRQLGEAGIEVTLRPGSWAQVLGRVRSGDSQFYYGAFTADTGDAGDILDSAIHTPDPAAGLGADNHFGYSSRQVDELLLGARTAPHLSTVARLSSAPWNG
jgi:ABC-type transport system substrate-binding protein